MDNVIVVTTALVCSVVVLDFGFCLRGHDKPQEGSIVTSASPRMGLVVIQTKEIDRWLLDARQCSIRLDSQRLCGEFVVPQVQHYVLSDLESLLSRPLVGLLASSASKRCTARC